MAAESGGKALSSMKKFFFGLIFGGFMSYVFIRFSDLRQYTLLDRSVSLYSDPRGNPHIVVDDTNRVSLEELQKFSQHKDSYSLGEDSLAKSLYNSVRVLCWVMTAPNNMNKKTIHVKATWAKRCNKVIYVSSENDKDFPTIAVVDHEGREYLWLKTRRAFTYIYQHHLQDADWFFKGDDDTFVVLENMRFLLSHYDPNQPIYFGKRFKPFIKQGYMSGGAGYVISRAGVEALITKAFVDTKGCKGDSFVGGAEDVEIGRCLEKAGVLAGDSRDKEGRETFHPFVPEQHLVPNILPQKFWYWSYNYYPAKEGPECCSDYSVSFHYVGPNAMYMLEYMVYHMRPFGVGYYTCPADIKQILHIPEIPEQHIPEKKDSQGKDVFEDNSKEIVVNEENKIS